MLKEIPEHNVPGHESSPMKGTDMLSHLVKFQMKIAALRSDRGATAVEYGLMVALIAIVIIVAVTSVALQRALGACVAPLPFTRGVRSRGDWQQLPATSHGQHTGHLSRGVAAV
jgi:Flp pilus assembly pilin Flp